MKKVNIKYLNERKTVIYFCLIISTICVLYEFFNKFDIFILIILIVSLIAAFYNIWKRNKFINKVKKIKETGQKIQGKVVNFICTNGEVISAINGISDDDLVMSIGAFGKIGDKDNDINTKHGVSGCYKFIVEYNDPISNEIKTCITPYFKTFPDEWENMICDIYLLENESYIENYRFSKKD